MQFPSCIFSICFIYIQVVYAYSSIDTATFTAWKKSYFILS